MVALRSLELSVMAAICENGVEHALVFANTSVTSKMPAQEVAVTQPPATESEENNVPSSQPIVGIIYPPPEVRSILCRICNEKRLTNRSLQNWEETGARNVFRIFTIFHIYDIFIHISIYT